MRWPRVAFVAAPEPDAEIRYDFHDDMHNTYPAAEGWSLGVSALAGDPDGIGVGLGLRTLTFTQVIHDHKVYALQRMSALARELSRRTNWLLFQLDDVSSPRWFQTWRAEPGDLSFEHYYAERDRNYWEIGVSIPAEPFAVGERVILPAVTVSNDPAAASNPCSLVIPAQPGDAPAPLRVDVEWSTSRDGYRSLVAAAPDRSAPIVWDVGVGDAWTAGPATGAGATYANTAGGSARLFAATTSVQTVIAGPAPVSVAAGRYRVWARVLRETTDGEFAVRLSSRYRGGTLSVTGAYTDTTWGATAADHATWLDLGEHAFPPGQPHLNAGTMVTPDVAVSAYRLSGTGGFRLDSLMVLPVVEESRSLLVDRTYGPATGASERVDGEIEAVTTWQAGAPRGSVAPATRGGFPMLHPGRPNLLTLLAQTKRTTARFNGAETPDRVADTATVTVSYQPRWLWIGED